MVVAALHHWLWCLRRHRLRQFAIGSGHSGLMTFPCPVFQVARLLFPHGNPRGKGLTQPVSERRKGLLLLDALDQTCVPNPVQVRMIVLFRAFLRSLAFESRLGSEEGHRQAVGSAIVVRRGVQWLMQISHKMNHKHQRFCLLFAVATPRPQEVQLLLEYTGDTAGRGTKITQFVARSLKWNINKMPVGCLGALVSNIIGPGGGVRKRVQVTRWTKALQSRVDRLPLEKKRVWLTTTQRVWQ